MCRSCTVTSHSINNSRNYALCIAKYCSPFKGVCTNFKNFPLGLDTSFSPSQYYATYFQSISLFPGAKVSHTWKLQLLPIPTKRFLLSKTVYKSSNRKTKARQLQFWLIQNPVSLIIFNSSWAVPKKSMKDSKRLYHFWTTLVFEQRSPLNYYRPIQNLVYLSNAPSNEYIINLSVQLSLSNWNYFYIPKHFVDNDMSGSCFSVTFFISLSA